MRVPSFMSVAVRGLWAVTLLAMVFPGISAAAVEADELQLVSTVWPPFTDGVGKPRFALELVHEALERAGVDERTLIVKDGKLTSSLRSGSFDGSAALWRSADREAYLLYSDAYLENRLILVGRKGRDVSARSFAELKGERVALVQDYAYGDEVDRAKEPSFVLGHSNETNLRKLLDGDVDYMLIDALVIRYIVEHYPEEAAAYLEIGSNALVTRSLHLAVRRDRPDAEAIVNGFNAQIRGMLADGTYNRILQLNWIRADVDGDGQPELVLLGDRAGKAPPTSGYRVLSTDGASPATATPTRFVIGGQTYDGWDSIPEEYKLQDPHQPDPAKNTVSVFKFRF